MSIRETFDGINAAFDLTTLFSRMKNSQEQEDEAL